MRESMSYMTNERDYVLHDQCKRVCLALPMKDSMSDMAKEREYI